MKEQYIWLSFRDTDNNKNLGVCIVQAEDGEAAVAKAWKLGINPGGECLMVVMDEEQFKEQDLQLDRLYTRDEMIKLGY